MISGMWIAATAAALVHVAIFTMESVWWTTPQVRARFRQTPEQAQATKLLAFNQGFYNLFLALGTFAGLGIAMVGLRGCGLILAYGSCFSMVGAAVVLVASAPQMWRGALIQGSAPLVFLVLATLHFATR